MIQAIINSVLCIAFFITICSVFYLIYLIKKQLKNKENTTTQDEMLNNLTNISNSLVELKTKEENSSHEQLKKSTELGERMLNLMHNFDELKKNSYQSSSQVENMFSTVQNLNDIMVNKKARGNWGEYQLNNLLSVYAGDNQNIFETQYQLKNGYIGDVALHLPDEEKVLIIDSKFPLENYQNLMKDNLNDIERAKYESLLKQNVKKHINDIARKYITSQTVENAVMFIPSEAIYMFICGNYGELIDYAHKKHILMTCPTTLIGVVFTLVNITKDFNRNKHIKQLEKDIVGMHDDAIRLNERLEVLDNSIKKLQKPFKDVSTSAGKVVNRVLKIYDGAIEEENNDDTQ